MISLNAEQRKAFDDALIDAGDVVSKGRMVCLNEQYDRGCVQGTGDGMVRFISCPCPNCSVRN